MIRCEESLDVARTKAEVFAFIDDPAQMPRWLAMCASLEQTSPPPKRVGTTLRYAYKEGWLVKLIDGSVTAYEPGRRLAMAFVDKAFGIAVAFDVATAGAATRLTYTVEIEPLCLHVKLLTPVIRVATKRQLAKDTETLKALLEAPAATGSTA